MTIDYIRSLVEQAQLAEQRYNQEPKERGVMFSHRGILIAWDDEKNRLKITTFNHKHKDHRRIHRELTTDDGWTVQWIDKDFGIPTGSIFLPDEFQKLGWKKASYFL